MTKSWFFAGLILALLIVGLTGCSPTSPTSAIKLNSQQEGIWVSGEGNESEWSNAGSFYVGFTLSQQALIYGIGNIRDADQIKIIIGIFVVILALLAFWISRRKFH